MINRTAVWFVVGVFALHVTSGCATLIDGSTQPVTFRSLPEGATVYVEGVARGKTPVVLELDRQSETIVEVQKDGYLRQSVEVENRMNGLLLVNLIWCLSCVLSTTTDYASGAAYHYDPDNYYVVLAPEGEEESPKAKKVREVKSFVLTNYAGLESELSNLEPDYTPSEYDDVQYGEHLDSLMKILEIPRPDQRAAVTKMQTMAKSASNSLGFADEVTKSFVSSTP